MFFSGIGMTQIYEKGLVDCLTKKSKEGESLVDCLRGIFVTTFPLEGRLLRCLAVFIPSQIYHYVQSAVETVNINLNCPLSYQIN